MASRFDKVAMSLLAFGAASNLGMAWLSKGFDVESAHLCHCPQLQQVLPRSVLQNLQRDGFAVHQGFLNGLQLHGARLHALSLVDAGRLGDSPNTLSIRQDQVIWIRDEADEKSEPTKSQGGAQESCRQVRSQDEMDPGRTDDGSRTFQECVRLLRGLASEIDAVAPDARKEAAGQSKTPVNEGVGGNVEASRGHLVPLDLQLACFDGAGSGYRAHRDNATGPSTSIWALGLIGFLQARPYRKRAITAILYLNDASWDCSKHGGALRMFLGAAEDDETGVTATTVLDVSPRGGTLVLFDSRVVLHQVERPSPRST